MSEHWTTSTYWSCACCGQDPKDCPTPVLPMTGPTREHVLHVERPALRLVPAPRYFLTVSQRLTQPPVRSDEVTPSPSMYDELLQPLWWTPAGIVFA